MNHFIFTTSWDDGHPLDLRVAEILAKYGCQGTFYIPCKNMEGHPVLSEHNLQLLAKDFEIGVHTLEHCYLDRVSLKDAKHQIIFGKKCLEDQIGKGIKGFCYPGGKHNHQIRSLVRNAGFCYARTIDNFFIDMHLDAFRIPTTLQLYPHSVMTRIFNFARKKFWGKRKIAFLTAIRRTDTLERLVAVYNEARTQGTFFHLWGHSWELDRINGWKILESFLQYVSKNSSLDERVDNFNLYKRLFI